MQLIKRLARASRFLYKIAQEISVGTYVEDGASNLYRVNKIEGDTVKLLPLCPDNDTFELGIDEIIPTGASNIKVISSTKDIYVIDTGAPKVVTYSKDVEGIPFTDRPSLSKEDVIVPINPKEIVIYNQNTRKPILWNEFRKAKSYWLLSCGEPPVSFFKKALPEDLSLQVYDRGQPRFKSAPWDALKHHEHLPEQQDIQSDPDFQELIGYLENRLNSLPKEKVVDSGDGKEVLTLNPEKIQKAISIAKQKSSVIELRNFINQNFESRFWQVPSSWYALAF